MQYLDFDQELRNGKRLTTKSETPLGYLEFAKTFNQNTRMDDFRRLSTFQTIGITADVLIEKSTQPVTLYDFKIHPEQYGYEVVDQPGLRPPYYMLPY
jgi:hypothetical protein